MSTQPAEGHQLAAAQHTAVARKRLSLYGRLIGSVFLFLGMAFILGASTTSSSAVAVPAISIVSVVTDQSVTIQTHNYPPNQTFVVRMNTMGTLGLNGPEVGTLQSGAGGSISGTYNIPASLKGQQQIAIRLDSAQGYYSYNWFWNNPSGGSDGGSGGQPPVTPPNTGSGYVGTPSFSIVSVIRDSNVTIQTNNFPSNQLFDVTMGPMYAQGFGVKVGEITNSGAFQQTFTIPPELYGQARISIRTQTRHADPFYAFNWFWNNSTDGSGGSGGDGGTGGVVPPPVVVGTPAITICTVVRDQSVTFQTSNYPANRVFTVSMGSLGTVAGTFDSGAGGSARQTIPIPGAVKGLNQITIQSISAPYYSYNWFWNTNTTADHCTS
jgi:hypothetical protein